MKRRDFRLRRTHAVVLVAVGLVIGVTMMATPAMSHVGGTVGHLWNNHIKPRADARYANAVAGTDKAKDADKLDGIHANELVRVGRDQNIGPSLTGAFATVTDVTITAPAAGFVKVDGTSVSYSGSGCPCDIWIRLRHAESDAVSFNYVQTKEANASLAALSATWVFPVSAGTNTFEAQMRNASGTSPSADAGITALYVPFGSTGGATLGRISSARQRLP